MSESSDPQSGEHNVGNSSHTHTLVRQRRYTRLAAIVVLILVALLKPRVDEWLGNDKDALPPGGDPAIVENDSTGDVDREVNGPDTAASVEEADTGPLPSDADETSGEGEPGQLTEIRPRVFQSTAGLLYLPGSEDGHRLQHIMEHAEDEPNRPIHGVFEGDQAAILRNIDIAYQKVLNGDSGVHSAESDDRIAYTIDLRNRIGYVGGQVGKRNDYPECRYVKLVLENGNEVITAYPTNRSR